MWSRAGAVANNIVVGALLKLTPLSRLLRVDQLKKHQQQRKKKEDGDASGIKSEAPTIAHVEQTEQDAPAEPLTEPSAPKAAEEDVSKESGAQDSGVDGPQEPEVTAAANAMIARAETPKSERNSSSSLQATIATLVSEKSGLADQLAELETKLQGAEESLQAANSKLEESKSLQKRLKDLEAEVEKSKGAITRDEAAKVQAEEKIKQLVSLLCLFERGSACWTQSEPSPLA